MAPGAARTARPVGPKAMGLVRFHSFMRRGGGKAVLEDGRLAVVCTSAAVAMLMF